jgi:drug/metabolite transporter (DMT)-like permease
MWLVLKLSGRPIKLVAPGPTIAIALSQVTGFMLFQSWALMEGGAGKTAVLIFTMPIWTLIMSWPILGERIRGSQWLAAASTLCGLTLIIEPWNMHSGLFGNFLGVMAALSWAVGTILIKRYRAQLPTDLLALTFWQMLLGAIPLTILAVLVPERATQWVPQFIGILAFVSVVSLAGCWLLWLYILNRLPAWEASLSVLGTPVVAILSSRLIMGEAFKPIKIAGIVLIASGLALLSLLGWLASRRAYDLLKKSSGDANVV